MTRTTGDASAPWAHPCQWLHLILALHITVTYCVLGTEFAPIFECSPEVAQGQAVAYGGMSQGRVWSQCPGEDFLVMLHHAQRHHEHNVPFHDPVTIFDIGANKCYSAAKFFNIWAPHMGFSPPVLHDFYKSLEASHAIPPFPSLLDSCGVCLDCMTKESVPVYAGAPALHVYSFEPTNFTHWLGSLAQNHFFTTTDVDPTTTPTGTPTSTPTVDPFSGVDGRSKWRQVGGTSGGGTLSGLSHHWYLSQIAVGARDGSLQWPADCTSEGCSADESAFAGHTFVEVPVVTVDTFVQQKDLKYIDFLKVDAEGYDTDVLTGAEDTLKARKVVLLMFEYHGVGLWKILSLKDVVDKLYSYGYVCYMAGRPTLARMTKCWHEQYETKTWSNVVCALEDGFAAALESMSFLANLDLP